MANSTSPAMPEVIVERALDCTDGDAPRAVTVRIYRPVQRRPEEWGCTVEITGLREPEGVFKQDLCGDDSVGALFHALAATGIMLKCARARYKGCNPWPIQPEPLDLIDPTSPLGLAADVVIERTLQLTGDGESQPVTIRIRKPVQHSPTEWSCVLDIVGLPGVASRHEVRGVDSAQALFLALDMVKTNVHLRRLSREGLNPWEVRLEPLEMGEPPPRPEPLPAEVIAERALELSVDPSKPPRPVKVLIYKPVPHGPNEWWCTVELRGLPHSEAYKRDSAGVDSTHALFRALENVGAELDRYRGRLRWANLPPWDFADPADMILPRERSE